MGFHERATHVTDAHSKRVSALAIDVHARMMRGDEGHAFYVYYKTDELAAFPEHVTPDPGVWTLACSERVPSDRTVDGVDAWLRRFTGRIPYLGTGGL